MKKTDNSAREKGKHMKIQDSRDWPQDRAHRLMLPPTIIKTIVLRKDQLALSRKGSVILTLTRCPMDTVVLHHPPPPLRQLKCMIIL